MANRNHVPIRTCVACRLSDEKRDLLRVVRQADGVVCYDPKGKLSGRGAYVCATSACILQARKQKKLERSLKVSSIPNDLFNELVVVLSARAAEIGTEKVTDSEKSALLVSIEVNGASSALHAPLAGQESEAENV